MHYQQLNTGGASGFGMTMACNGVFLMPAYDIERGRAADDLWYVVHHSTAATMAVLTTQPERALEIAIEIANLREWPDMAEPAWIDDRGFADLLAKYSGEAAAPSVEDWEDDVPYGPSR